jgi:hypothetical protein
MGLIVKNPDTINVKIPNNFEGYFYYEAIFNGCFFVKYPYTRKMHLERKMAGTYASKPLEHRIYVYMVSKR